MLNNNIVNSNNIHDNPLNSYHSWLLPVFYRHYSPVNAFIFTDLYLRIKSVLNQWAKIHAEIYTEIYDKIYARM